MYTIEVYKKDRRTSDGYRFIMKIEMDCSGERDLHEKYNWAWSPEIEVDYIEDRARSIYPPKKGYRLKINKTMVERKNFMTGESFMERYDTPRFCSPASESFWTM